MTGPFSCAFGERRCFVYGPTVTAWTCCTSQQLLEELLRSYWRDCFAAIWLHWPCPDV